MTTLPSITPVPIPFCNEGNKDAILIASSASVPNMTDGFPAAFSTPNNYVTRPQMNGILNLATANESARQCGQIVTFDTTVSSAIGGYAQGAILDYLNAGTLYKVVSLVGNNTYDFTENGVDGVHWAYCSTSINKVYPDFYHAQELVNSDVTSTVSSNISVTNGAVTNTYQLTNTNDFFVSYSYITKLTSGGGYDLEFAVRNVNASTSEVSWTAIQSAMWMNMDSSNIGYINGNIYLHGGQTFAIVNPSNSVPTSVDGAWLTIRAFPLIA